MLETDFAPQVDSKVSTPNPIAIPAEKVADWEWDCEWSDTQGNEIYKEWVLREKT